jgi:hypothetical protein
VFARAVRLLVAAVLAASAFAGPRFALADPAPADSPSPAPASPVAAKPAIPLHLGTNRYPEPTPLPADAHCDAATPAPHDIGYDEAFSTPVRSTRALRFVSYLANLDAKDQSRILGAVKAAAGSLRDPSQVERGCRTEPAIATVRALNLLANFWSTDIGNPGEPGFRSMMRGIERAIVQLERPDASRDATAFTPFFASPSTFDDPAPPSEQCTGGVEGPAALHVAQPPYPTIAATAGTAGAVSIMVYLDGAGFVESARPLSSTADGKVGGESLKLAALLSAEQTTYAPERVHCVGQPGQYIFRANFEVRRP